MNVLLIAVRAVHFGAVAILFGGAGFLLALGHRPHGAMAMLRVAAVVVAVSGAGWFTLVFADVAGHIGALSDPEAWSAFSSAPFGSPWLIRLALCALALLLGVAGAPTAMMALGTALVVDQAWLGHAAVGGGTLGLVFYELHVGAGFAWVGALVTLGVASLTERRVSADGLVLFDRYGVALITALVIGALAEAAARGLTPGDLATTPYGRLVAGKSLALVAMLALATWHRTRWRRHETLRLTLPIETALGLVVLGLAATLGVTPPPG